MSGISKEKNFYVTTPIYYVNAKPHLGHVYTTLVADTLARYARQQGKKTFFVTGTDEHGQKIERAAAAMRLPVQEHVDSVVAEFKAVFSRFNISNDRWIRTTDQDHKRGAQQLFRAVKEAGYIYKGDYEGWYCTECGEFKEESVVGEAPWCETHERQAERIAESSYFFKLSAFQDKLLNFYKKYPSFIQPESRQNEVVSFVSGGLRDLSISRISVEWGIHVPDDPEHTLYVWFDALSNYITALGYGDNKEDNLKEFWPVATHIVGKDILKFHAVYWPAFLMAAGLEPPREIFAHGMWLSGGRKMSKSLGNVIDLNVLLNHFSCEQIRYFCLREMSYGQDGDFTYELLIDRVNGDLASGLGNLVSRILTMVKNYFDGSIPNVSNIVSSDITRAAAVIQNQFIESKQAFINEFNRFAIGRAVEVIWELIAVLDKYISSNEPWKLVKDVTKKDHLAVVLYTAAEGLRHITVLLASIMPESAKSIWTQMGLTETPNKVNIDLLNWSPFVSENKIGQIVGLFPKMDKTKIMSEIQQELIQDQVQKQVMPIEENEYITIDDFAKIELKAGQVLEAERLPKSDKLLRLQVDLGEEMPRQVLAGIAQHYNPEDLVGSKILVVANLAPRQLRGFESRGMLLAASNSEGTPVIVTFATDVKNGSRVK